MAYHWAPLAEGQTPRIYAPGQLIYLQGTEADVFYYLLSGKARSYISSASGGERVLATHRSGDLMGEASFFDACPRVSSAVAVTECRVVSVDRDRLDRIFRAHPSLALPMLQHVDNMSFLQADRRVARCLLTFQEETDGALHCTHEELGAAVGVSRVTVSRVLSEFARRGFLETGYRSMRILDRGALIDFASQRED